MNIWRKNHNEEPLKPCFLCRSSVPGDSYRPVSLLRYLTIRLNTAIPIYAAAVHGTQLFFLDRKMGHLPFSGSCLNRLFLRSEPPGVTDPVSCNPLSLCSPPKSSDFLRFAHFVVFQSIRAVSKNHCEADYVIELGTTAKNKNLGRIQILAIRAPGVGSSVVLRARSSVESIPPVS